MRMCGRRLFWAFCLALITSLGATKAASAQNIQAFETELDETIRAACHSYMVDSIPDGLGWLRSQIYENSPFCLKVKAAYDEEAIGEAVQSAFKVASKRGGDLDLSNKQDRDLNVTIQCDAEYMCIESRLRYQETATPVSQGQYDRVAAYCTGRYGCIQAFFDEWPRDIPQPVAAGAGAGGLSFSSLLPPPGLPRTNPTATPAPAPTATPVTSTAKTASASPRQTTSTSTAGASEALLRQNARIERACACSIAGRACFKNRQGPIRDHVARLEARRKAVCTAWQGDYSALGASTSVEADSTKADLDAVWQELVSVDRTVKSIIQIAEDWFANMAWHVQNNRPFNVQDYTPRVEAMVQKIEDQPLPAFSGRGKVASAASPTAVSRGSQTSAQALHVGPNLPFARAQQYCRERGMTLPTIAMAQARLTELQSGDPFFGVWTTDQTETDRLGNRRRAQMNNGFSEGFAASSNQRTVCFPK